MGKGGKLRAVLEGLLGGDFDIDEAMRQIRDLRDRECRDKRHAEERALRVAAVRLRLRGAE